MDNLLTRLKRQLPLVILTLLVTTFFLLHTADAFKWRFITQLENFLYDSRVVLTMPGGIDPRIVIVDIDEKSLAEIGRWPWGRDQVARLVGQLFDNYEIQILGFDIVFSEPDSSSGLEMLDKLGRTSLSNVDEFLVTVDEMREQLDYDLVFRNSLLQRDVVLGYYFQLQGDEESARKNGILPLPVLSSEDFTGTNKVLAREAPGYSANLPRLQAVAGGGGHFNPWVDDDGVVRRVPLLIEFESNYYESLAMAMARKVLEVDKVVPVFEEALGNSGYPALEWLRLGANKLPVDQNVQALVPYRGRFRSFNYVSASDVINNRLDKDVLKEAIVLVGTTAPGLFDLRSVPVGKAYAGVEVHANLLAGMLDGTIKKKPAYTLGAEFILLLVLGLFLATCLPLLSPIAASLTTLVLLIALTLGNFAFWQFANLVMPLASTILMILIVFLLNMSYGFFIERRGKKQIASMFGQYVPPELVDEMSDNPEVVSFDAENRQLTVLFSDVRGFTTLSESLSPGDLSLLMNEYLTAMTKIIHENRGTIDKYMGDAVMAFWGAPIRDEDHARHALETGMAMLERLNAIQDDFKARGWPEIKIGVGLNSGMMSVGDMGSEFRRAYTVLGDAVNLGSRLEGLTKNYGVEIIVGEATKDLVEDYTYRELDVVRVKGKDEPVTIYEPIAPKAEISKEEAKELSLHKETLKLYRAQDWDRAEMQFLNLQKVSPDRLLYQIYVDRIMQYRQSPPPENWDGVFTHTSK
ncbi:MAG: CHASE2 domain-containing protein [Gammaproteobacteria bacterium]|nr:CHASE2 domain-containing protein [Gammaproteobacteria bacterium]